MPAIKYKKYFLFSLPYYDEEFGRWHPYASVWNVFGYARHNTYYYHHVKELNNSFKTEEQALSFGFIIARAWIDELL